MTKKDFEAIGENNRVEIGQNITLTGWLKGNNNRIEIAGARTPQKLHIQIHGDKNTVVIGGASTLSGLRVEFGNRKYSTQGGSLQIGPGFSIASQGRFLLPNPANRIEIGADCMFSNAIVLRGGEYPHLVFDLETGDYLDVSDGIFIGNHVWVGEGAYINKSVTIPDNCIVGARSVVTKRFTRQHAVIAGNPARVVKQNVAWIGNERLLEHGSPQKASFDAQRTRQLAKSPPE